MIPTVGQMAATMHTRRARLAGPHVDHGYRRAWLSRDALAGLAAGAVVIPQVYATPLAALRAFRAERDPTAGT